MASLAVLTTLLFSAGPTPTLREAIDAYQRLDDAHAIAEFQRILAMNPPSEIAAKAHLYLGLIAFNAIHPDLARAEFKKAIQANAALDVPPDTSPKAALAFAEARQEVAREVAQLEVPAAARPLRPPEVAAVASPVAPPVSPAIEAAPSSHSHLLALTLGGVAVALGVVAVVGGVQVLDYNSLVNTDNANHGNPGQPVASAYGSASFWRYGWIAFAAGGAAALAAGVLTW